MNSGKYYFNQIKLSLLPCPTALSWILMLLIAAALEEELNIALKLCRDRRKLQGLGAGVWQAIGESGTICFLKTGIGPRKSAASLVHVLQTTDITKILVIGYAGALDPSLSLGDLVVVGRALACSLEQKDKSLEDLRMDDVFELTSCTALADAAKSIGLNTHSGDILTSPHVIGEPAHKKFLHDKFHASICDMETAALARIAKSSSIPIGCMRVVSDEVRDTFLVPFSHDPASKAPARAVKFIGKGDWIETYRRWKKNSSVARESLHRVLSQYL
jgi:adenosylhomocysteine nucleosidase